MTDDYTLPATVEEFHAGETTAILRYSVFAELMVVRSRTLPTAGVVRWADHVAQGMGPLVVHELAPGVPALPLYGPVRRLLGLSTDSLPGESDDRHWTDRGL